MLKQKYFLTDFFILSAEKQPIKLSWRNIEWLQSFQNLGISYEEKAFYDILKSIAKQFGFEYPEEKLLKLAAEIKTIVADKSKYTDWSTRDDIKAELKMDLILILAEYGYPPVTNDEVFKEILEQAENFKKYNG